MLGKHSKWSEEGLKKGLKKSIAAAVQFCVLLRLGNSKGNSKDSQYRDCKSIQNSPNHEFSPVQKWSQNGQIYLQKIKFMSEINENP